MSEEEAVNRLVLQNFAAMMPKPFVFCGFERDVLFTAICPAVAGKVRGEGDSQIRVNPAKCPLQKGRGEYFLDAFVTVVAWTQSISVADHAAQPVVFAGNRFAVNGNAQFVFEVTVRPEIVVADMVVNGQTRIGNAGNRSQ